MRLRANADGVGLCNRLKALMTCSDGADSGRASAGPTESDSAMMHGTAMPWEPGIMINEVTRPPTI